LKSQGDEKQSFDRHGDELPLSGPALAQLLDAVLQRGAPFRFCAKGWSMSPFIKDGDVITVSPLGERAPAIGDVVAFQHSDRGRLVVHRIVGSRNNTYAIQGDSLPQADDVVQPAEILGRVVRVERNGRPVRLGLGPERVLIALLTRSGLFLRLVIPLWVRVRFIFRRPA